MIDILPDVVTRLRAPLLEAFPKIHISGDEMERPPSFPCVAITERDNATLERTHTGSENHATILIQIEAYSNKKAGRVSECRAIFSVIDTEMERMGFTRLVLNHIENPADTSIYRLIGRYKAVSGKDKTIYRR